MTSINLESSSVESRVSVFAALSDPTRLRIVDLLSDLPRCVCDLQEAIDIAPNLLSYHLRVLRDAGLVEGARRGRWVDYRLATDAGGSVRAALPSALAGRASQ